MKWLSKLIRGGASRENWPGASQRITKGFGAARIAWFDLCVQQIQRYVKVDLPMSAQSLTLDRLERIADIDRVLKAYQLGSTTGWIAHYITESEAKDFTDLFWGQVCGVDLPQINAILKELHGIKEFGRALYITRRIAEHITGTKSPMAEAIFLAGLVPEFELFSRKELAYAFGDHSAGAKLQSHLDGWEQRFHDYVKGMSKKAA